MITYNIDNVEDLVLWNILIHNSSPINLNDVSNLDVTLLGLTQKAWVLNKGKRDYRDYLLDGVLSVKFRYDYIFDNNKITDFDIYIDYYKNDGTVGISKKLEKELSKKYLVEFNRVIRQNQIDYLMGAGDDLRNDAELLPEPQKSELIAFADLIDSLWLRYETEILEYINTGNDVLLNRINNESDEPYLTGINTIDPEIGFTMKQIMINQIT